MINYPDGRTEFIGAVFDLDSHYWMDGMEEVHAVCYDSETGSIVRRQVGYFGCDGQNLCGCGYSVDITRENAKKVFEIYLKDAETEFFRSVADYQSRIHKNEKAVVVKGRKIPKGTKLDIFWVGERPTYRSRYYDWMHETEEIAGGKTENGEKVWIKTDYLQNITEYPPVSETEKQEFISDYLRRNLPVSVRNIIDRG